MPEVKKRRKSIILRIGIIIFSVYLVISLTTLQVTLMERGAYHEDQQAEVVERKQNVSKLLKLLDSGTEKDFIERAARERLGYVYADEIVYTDISGN